MKNNSFFFLIIVSYLSSCVGQTISKQKRTVYNEEFKWTITIPEGFDTVSAAKWARMQNRGAELVEKTYDVEIENHAKTIFVFHHNQFNYFESNHQPFDSAVDGNWFETFKEVNKILYGTFQAQMPGARLDSSSSTRKISGLSFQTFEIVITLPKVTMYWKMFSRLFGKSEFTVNILTADKLKEAELLDSWLNSKFEK